MQNYDSEYALISQVAHMYYNLEMSQPEIAEKLFFSRSKVSRILTKARDLGIVEIKVRRLSDRVPTLENTLKKIFHLRDAVVITNFDDATPCDSLDILTDFAALYLSDQIHNGHTIGISWGNTVSRVVNKLRNSNYCRADAVQLMGCTTPNYNVTESRELVDKLRKTFSGEGYYLNAPLYIDNTYAKDVLLQDASILRAMEKMHQCTFILSGLGDFGQDTGKSTLFGYSKPELVEELKNKHAAGSICAQFYDINGEWIDCQWNRNCIAMPFRDLSAFPNVIAVATGKNKVRPILGAVRGGIANVLITDIQTATDVISEYHN